MIRFCPPSLPLACASAGLVMCRYDGDGKADLALYQPSTGNWHIASLHRMAMIAKGGLDYIPVLPAW